MKQSRSQANAACDLRVCGAPGPIRTADTRFRSSFYRVDLQFSISFRIRKSQLRSTPAFAYVCMRSSTL